jgi:hypothetical protein
MSGGERDSQLGNPLGAGGSHLPQIQQGLHLEGAPLLLLGPPSPAGRWIIRACACRPRSRRDLRAAGATGPTGQ